MMPNEMLTRDVIRQIFSGSKKLMKLKDVKFIQAPKYDEISVKRLYSKLIELDKMKQYFPNTYCKGRQADHDYLFNIANSLHPKVIKELIEHAQSQRFDIKEEKQKQESILLSEEWEKELKAMPFFSQVRNYSLSNFIFREKKKLQLF